MQLAVEDNRGADRMARFTARKDVDGEMLVLVLIEAVLARAFSPTNMFGLSPYCWMIWRRTSMSENRDDNSLGMLFMVDLLTSFRP